MTTSTKTLEPDSPSTPTDLGERYRQVRAQTVGLCETLEPEDFLVQAMPDASPTKWHVAHTSWFFETFVLSSLQPGYRYVRDDANYLFNSYYNAIGERIARDRRGLLSRPSIAEVWAYRRGVDERMNEALASITETELSRISPIVTLGLHHEQQHQELILMDIKAAFGSNPTRPVFRERTEERESSTSPSLGWISHGGGLAEIGHCGEGFAFDNESPRHTVYLQPFEIASRLATNGEYLEFMNDGGYDRAEFWLSDGWAARTAMGWKAPGYWELSDQGWRVFTLSGMKPVNVKEPVSHLSLYEADAFARWSEARLPTEAEWEQVAAACQVEGHFLESGRFHPAPAGEPQSFDQPQQLFGDLWEWTSSPYTAYPGYRAAAGALGEYNGKFMCNQMVLRGGCYATPQSHIRSTYRNFFGPSSRWLFSGVRLAR